MDINNETTQAIIGGVSFSLVTLFLFVIFSKRQPGQGSWLLQTAKALGIFGFLFGFMLLFALLTFLNNPQFFLQPFIGESLQPKHYLFIVIIGILGPWLAQYIITSIKRRGDKNSKIIPLSSYHQKYANQPDEEIQKRIAEKKKELVEIFSQTKLGAGSNPARIAIFGCGDKRFISGHKEIFEHALGKPAKITTFDITIDHLLGEENVFQHDCALPLPHGPFDITYAHVLLRFIETERQWDVIKNSFDALNPGGLALHVLDREDYETTEPKLSNGLFSVPLKRWKTNLDNLGIKHTEIPITHGLALILTKK